MTMVGVPADQMNRLDATITQYEKHGPNAKFGDGSTVAQRLLSVARETVRAGVSGKTGFEDSLYLDMIEKWTREHRFALATMLAEKLREGKPIRQALEEVIGSSGGRARA